MPGRGRPRTRDVEKWNEIERDYMTKYAAVRRKDPDDCYKLVQSRSYYKRVLRNMDENHEKYEKISQKVADLDTKIKEYQANHVKYRRRNIIVKNPTEE